MKQETKIKTCKPRNQVTFNNILDDIFYAHLTTCHATLNVDQINKESLSNLLSQLESSFVQAWNFPKSNSYMPKSIARYTGHYVPEVKG